MCKNGKENTFHSTNIYLYILYYIDTHTLGIVYIYYYYIIVFYPHMTVAYLRGEYDRGQYTKHHINIIYYSYYTYYYNIIIYHNSYYSHI